MNIPQNNARGPLAMAIFIIGISPLIELLQKSNVTQKWYADDGTAASDLKNLRAILDNLDLHGKAFGYNIYILYYSILCYFILL